MSPRERHAFLAQLPRPKKKFFDLIFHNILTSRVIH
jgi:hypothetical protein